MEGMSIGCIGLVMLLVPVILVLAVVGGLLRIVWTVLAWAWGLVYDLCWGMWQPRKEL